MLLPDSVTYEEAHAFAVLVIYLLLFLVPLNVVVTLWTLLAARSVRNIWVAVREARRARRGNVNLDDPELVAA